MVELSQTPRAIKDRERYKNDKEYRQKELEKLRKKYYKEILNFCTKFDTMFLYL